MFGNDSGTMNETPDMQVEFQEGLNLIVGPNDSGKTAIIDAIKLVLKTKTQEWIRVQQSDFYNEKLPIRIMLTISGMSKDEIANFLEYITIDQGNKVELKLVLEAKVSENGRIYVEHVKNGIDGTSVQAEAKSLLEVTYLKPLRDANEDLSPRRNSRISQILAAHSIIRKEQNSAGNLLECIKKYADEIEKYFKTGDGSKIYNDLIKYVLAMMPDTGEVFISPKKQTLKELLENLAIQTEYKNPGLGTLNRLCMAMELISLADDVTSERSLRLVLIEELEAHLHPMAQLRVIKALEEEKKFQFILTSHSPHLASQVPLERIIRCIGSKRVVPLDKQHTGMEDGDYIFMKKFFDVTKSNLLFAKRAILVEGWSEAIFIESFSKYLKKIGYIAKDISESEVTVINVIGRSFQRYKQLFYDKKNNVIISKAGVITDMDSKPKWTPEKYNEKLQAKIDKYGNEAVKVFVSEPLTLELSIYNSNIVPNCSSYIKQILSQNGYSDNTEGVREALKEKEIDKTELALKMDNEFKSLLAREDFNIKEEYDKVISDKNGLLYIAEALKYVTTEMP